MEHNKPIAFIDVDGVLNRLVSNSVGKKRGLLRTHGEIMGHRYTLHLDPADRHRIKRLVDVFELAWGTTWEHEADEQIGRPLRLPPISRVATTAMTEPHKAHGIVRASEGRPFVWFEDDGFYYRNMDMFAPACQPFKVIKVNPIDGLTDENIDEALNWFAQLDKDQ